MTSPVLATKLYMPLPRPNAVHRRHLHERLNAGLHRSKLTLISAPAGFGKTTLVSDWLTGCERPVAWLSLDDGDNDPARFLTYLVAALQTIVADLGDGFMDALHSRQPPPTEALLTSLLNNVAATVADPCVLVLDDYHVLDAQPVDQAVAFLIEHLPPTLHMVIATRDDPRLPLARLRGGGQLTELRAADLRFSPAEADELLNAGMDLRLSTDDIAILEARTEGWIVGLQLAALSLQGRQGQDTAAFIQAFAGDHRYIVDYLVDEVLARQPDDVRSFLLQTALLDQMTGSLCDAVTGRDDGDALLMTLERGNYFVVPLDDQRRWFRYHRLFADVLHVRVLAERPEQVAMLHRRASAWYEQQGLAVEAIRHALAAGDDTRAASLIELAVPSLRQPREEAALLGWLRELPDQLIQQRPVLSVWYAHALLASGELDGVERRLRDAERWLDARSDKASSESSGSGRREGESADAAEMVAVEMVVMDDHAFQRLAATIAMARAARALALGDVAATVRHAEHALAVVREEDEVGRGGAVALLGLASWASGDLETAYRMFAEGMARVQRAGLLSDAINGAIALADIRFAQGRLREAMHHYEQGVQLATPTQQEAPMVRGAADMYVGMSEVLREENDLDAAMHQLARSQELGEQAGMPQFPYRWRVAMARLREAQGDLDAALNLLHEAERRYVSDFFPTTRPVAALAAQVWVKQGKLGEAFGWVRERGLSGTDALSYPREFEHLTLARVLLAQYKSDRTEHSLRDAMGLLERLLTAAEAAGRTGSVLDILVVQALTYQACGDISAALVPLRQALMLAEPEGYVRLFVDEGAPMAALLKAAAQQRVVPTYVRQLLAAFGTASDHPPAQQDDLLIEPLSERELDVLRLLGTDLDGPEIASELMVSLNTMRTHTKNIYSKLGVNNRRAAVRRAEELGLLSQSRRH